MLSYPAVGAAPTLLCSALLGGKPQLIRGSAPNMVIL